MGGRGDLFTEAIHFFALYRIGEWDLTTQNMQS
jgi:hypothetical protein